LHNFAPTSSKQPLNSPQREDEVEFEAMQRAFKPLTD
jgi:hypothetical protein